MTIDVMSHKLFLSKRTEVIPQYLMNLSDKSSETNPKSSIHKPEPARLDTAELPASSCCFHRSAYPIPAIPEFNNSHQYTG